MFMDDEDEAAGTESETSEEVVADEATDEVA